jgi:hypothetical protein
MLIRRFPALDRELAFIDVGGDLRVLRANQVERLIRRVKKGFMFFEIVALFFWSVRNDSTSLASPVFSPPAALMLSMARTPEPKISVIPLTELVRPPL